MSRTSITQSRPARLVLAAAMLWASASALHAQNQSAPLPAEQTPPQDSMGMSSESGSDFMGMGHGMRAAGSSYLEINAGQTDFARLNTGLGNFGHDNNDTTYGLAIGSFFPGQNLGVEVGYTNFGKVQRAGGDTKAEGLSLSLIGRLPLTDSFNLLGKVGTTYGSTDVSANSLSGVKAGSESGFDWSYGVGAEWVFNPQWSVLLGYSEHRMEFAGDNNERVSATTVGARWSF
ncbi:MAG: TonB-dependent receptor [Rhodoferax sp.]|nr:TonB-dependent receptor [Rhodoferax sp.]